MADPLSTSLQASAEKAGAMRAGGINPKLIDTVSVSLDAFLGDARMTVAELTALKEGSVVALEASLAQEVELRLNGVPVGRGELVTVGDKFAVRLTEISK